MVQVGKWERVLGQSQAQAQPIQLTQNPTQKHKMVYSIPSTQHSQLKIPVTIGTIDTWAMVDSGATGNFLLERFVRDNQI